MGEQTNTIPVALAKKLKVGDTVFLRRWVNNKKSGTKRMTVERNAIVAVVTDEGIAFKDLSNYYKEGLFNEYGTKWSVEPPHNSYDVVAQNEA